MKFKPPVNENYAATIAKLKTFVDLENCDNVKAALIFGNSVIVSKDCQVGDVGLFFPVECQLSKEFLGQNNLFRKPELGNIDLEKTGFFEHHGRVKAVKFRGHKSEGFWIPIKSLSYTGVSFFIFEEGLTFDFVLNHEICKKYVVKKNVQNSQRGKKAVDLKELIADGQFRFHFDTENLRKNIHEIKSDAIISITDKWHGTSAVYSNVLVKRKLNPIEWLLKKLGVKIQDTKYGFVYSSRKVIKNVDDRTYDDRNFYDDDIWGIVAKEIKDQISKGITIYGEIVGYLPGGAVIQQGYHYGCQVGEHKFLVYRVTFTNADGQVFELPVPQMREFCQKNGLEMVKEFYYGRADSFTKIDAVNSLENWHNVFLGHIEKKYIKDEMCPYNNYEVPQEGIVVRVDCLNGCRSFKLKNFKFLEHETKLLDSGTTDIEENN